MRLSALQIFFLLTIFIFLFSTNSILVESTNKYLSSLLQKIKNYTSTWK